MIPRERRTSAASLMHIAYVMLRLSILVHLQDNNVHLGANPETHSKRGNGEGVRETQGGVKAGSQCGELGISIYWELREGLESESSQQRAGKLECFLLGSVVFQLSSWDIGSQPLWSSLHAA